MRRVPSPLSKLSYPWMRTRFACWLAYDGFLSQFNIFLFLLLLGSRLVCELGPVSIPKAHGEGCGASLSMLLPLPVCWRRWRFKASFLQHRKASNFMCLLERVKCFTDVEHERIKLFSFPFPPSLTVTSNSNQFLVNAPIRTRQSPVWSHRRFVWHVLSGPPSTTKWKETRLTSPTLSITAVSSILFSKACRQKALFSDCLVFRPPRPSGVLHSQKASTFPRVRKLANSFCDHST